eukprot:4772845-Alexandrium_andersonii.AAC.1
MSSHARFCKRRRGLALTPACARTHTHTYARVCIYKWVVYQQRGRGARPPKAASHDLRHRAVEGLAPVSYTHLRAHETSAHL